MRKPSSHRSGRREFLGAAAGATLLAATSVPVAAGAAVAADTPDKSKLGLVTYCCRIRSDHLKKQRPAVSLFDPATFLEHCRSLGAGGMQIGLGIQPKEQSRRLRDMAAAQGMFIEAIISVPREEKDVEKFEASVKTAVESGAMAARTTIIPGRRYEYFDSLEKFRDYDQRGRRALELAAPIVEKYKLPLAVENHKDHRDAERVALFEHISSEYVGACVDTGNSVALLEDAIETARALAPWALSVHLKDQAVQPYADGFLLADIPLGQGSLDLPKIVDILRKAKPNVNFSLELITRDPLKVPTHTDKYWATFPDLPASQLARSMRFVRDNTIEKLQYISKLNPQQRLAREDANVQESLAYAKHELGL